MNKIVWRGVALAALLFAGVTAQAQTAPVPPADPPTQQTPAKKFPFPGETTATKPAPPSVDAPDAPASANPPADGADSKASAAKKFPFPGENPGDAGDGSLLPSAPADRKPQPPKEDDAGFSSSSSSASGGDGSNAQPPLNDAGSSGDTPDEGTHGHRKFVPRPVHQMTPDEREADDLDVAGFYMNDRNYKGAYARAQEAVALKPEDSYAQMALGQAAQKMGKPEEARAAFARVLELDAPPKQKKDAQKALSELPKL